MDENEKYEPMSLEDYQLGESDYDDENGDVESETEEAETETEAVPIKETEGRGNGSRDGINTVGGGNVCRGGIRDSKRHRGR